MKKLIIIAVLLLMACVKQAEIKIKERNQYFIDGVFTSVIVNYKVKNIGDFKINICKITFEIADYETEVYHFLLEIGSEEEGTVIIDTNGESVSGESTKWNIEYND